MTSLHPLVERLLDGFSEAAPMVAAHAAECDDYLAQMLVAARTLHHTATAMDAEGIPEDVQRRILCSALYGVPSEKEGLRLVRDRVREVEVAQFLEESLREPEA
jgi:hypothetical protein